MLKTYVISLEYPQKLMESMPALGLDPVWSPGVDGKKIPTEKYIEHIRPLTRDLVTPSALGCALAHINTWEKIVENNDPYALIVEDDVIFIPHFKEKFAEIFPSTPADYDVLYLGCFGCDSRFSVTSIAASMVGAVRLDSPEVQINRDIAIPAVANATHAYIVSNKGARALLQHIKHDIKFHIDYTMQLLADNKHIIRYVTTPRLAFQTSTDTTVSTNTGKTHPYLLHRAFSSFYVDTHVRGDYGTRLVGLKLGQFLITGAAAIMAIAGIAAAIARINILYLIIGFTALSIPDFIQQSDASSIILHFALFIGPSLLRDLWVSRASLKASRRK